MTERDWKIKELAKLEFGDDLNALTYQKELFKDNEEMRQRNEKMKERRRKLEQRNEELKQKIEKNKKEIEKNRQQNEKIKQGLIRITEKYDLPLDVLESINAIINL